MQLPILEFYNEEGVINKESYMKSSKDAFRNMQLIQDYNIDTALMFFIKDDMIPEEIRQDLEEFYNFKFASNINKAYIYKKKFVIAIAPLGEPASAGLMEELGFMGITKFYACGTCGLIDTKIDSSKLFLVKRAIRDEGLSFKYEKPGIYTYTDKELTEELGKYFESHGIKFENVTTWTTDCFYRETPKMIEKRLSQGANTVEMECAGWCSVAKFRNYQFAQVLYTSDVTNQCVWSGFGDKEMRMKARLRVFNLLVDYLLDQNKGKLC